MYDTRDLVLLLSRQKNEIAQEAIENIKVVLSTVIHNDNIDCEQKNNMINGAIEALDSLDSFLEQP